jgi:hypothetical protein
MTSTVGAAERCQGTMPRSALVTPSPLVTEARDSSSLTGRPGS